MASAMKFLFVFIDRNLVVNLRSQIQSGQAQTGQVQLAYIWNTLTYWLTTSNLLPRKLTVKELLIAWIMWFLKEKFFIIFFLPTLSPSLFHLLNFHLYFYCIIFARWDLWRNFQWINIADYWRIGVYIYIYIYIYDAKLFERIEHSRIR